MFVFFEELKECRAFPRIEAPIFLDNESRNPNTKVIDVGYFGSLQDSSARTIERLIGRSLSIRNAASSKVTL